MYIGFWVVPDDTRDLVLVLRTGVILDGELYGMRGIEPGLVACNANALPAVLLLQL